MTATLWFDPGCPYTWRTSRWLRAVTRRRGEELRYRFLSIAVLHEGQDVDEPYRSIMAYAQRVHRVLVAAEQFGGQAAVDRLYTAVGTRLHDQGADQNAATLAEAVAEAGLPPQLLDRADDTSLDAVVRASHDEAQARVGTGTGSPVTAIGDGPAYFGPVVVPIPEGVEADRLFEALTLLSSVAAFSELKRGRNPI